MVVVVVSVGMTAVSHRVRCTNLITLVDRTPAAEMTTQRHHKVLSSPSVWRPDKRFYICRRSV